MVIDGEEYSRCQDCGDMVPASEIVGLPTLVSIDGEVILKHNVCKKCKEEYEKCSRCGVYYRGWISNWSNFVIDKNIKICSDCAVIGAGVCNRCGKKVLKDTLVRIDNMNICKDCADNHSIVCKKCGKKTVTLGLQDGNVIYAMNAVWAGDILII